MKGEDYLYIKEICIHSICPSNTRASAALGKLALVIPRCRINRRFSLLMRVCGTCYRLACKVVAPRALLRALETCAYGGLSLSFLYLYFSLFLLFYSLFGIMVLGQFWFIRVSIPNSMCQVILLIIINISDLHDIWCFCNFHQYSYNAYYCVAI